MSAKKAGKTRTASPPRKATRFPNPAAVEGEIVHALIERLFRRLALAGFPEPGSDRFRAEVTRVDLLGSVRRLVDEHQERVGQHPRGSGFRMSKNPQQLVNQVVRLFRDTYAKAATVHRRTLPLAVEVNATAETEPGEFAHLLRARRALSELPVCHPALPFRGVIDLVWLDSDVVVIVDFKTGQERLEHALQVSCYALIWWRLTGVLPGRAEIRYPSRVQGVPVTEGGLKQMEENLHGRIERITQALGDRPASPQLGDYCQHCDVRPFCASYWAGHTQIPPLPARNQKRPIDLELLVSGVPTPAGFEAVLADDTHVPVVFEEGCRPVFGPINPGERLRLLGAQQDAAGVVELKPWTEVFHLLPESRG